MNNSRPAGLQHELPEEDLTQGRGSSDKSFIFQSVSVFFVFFHLFNVVHLFASIDFSLFYRR